MTDSCEVGIEYDLAFILKNPILTVCLKCKRKEPINAPRIENVRCFWCSSKVIPTDIKAYKERVSNLWRHVAGGPDAQMDLPLIEAIP